MILPLQLRLFGSWWAVLFGSGCFVHAILSPSLVQWKIIRRFACWSNTQLIHCTMDCWKSRCMRHCFFFHRMLLMSFSGLRAKPVPIILKEEPVLMQHPKVLYKIVKTETLHHITREHFVCIEIHDQGTSVRLIMPAIFILWQKTC